MATPSWEIISIALKSLLSRYDLDLSGVGLAQRMEYSDFETIFYHLFNIIDAKESRTRFKRLYPTRNKQDEAKFIELSKDFINNMKIVDKKISSTQLRALGGEPFRKIMASVVQKAFRARLGSPGGASSNEVPAGASKLDHLFDSLEKSQVIKDKTSELDTATEKLNQKTELLLERRAEFKKSWDTLNAAICCDTSFPAYTPERMKEIYRSLLDRLDKSIHRIKKASNQMVELPIDNIESPRVGRNSSVDVYREIREHLKLENSPTTTKISTTKEISQQLAEYDREMDILIAKWTVRLEKADEALLRDDQMRDRLKFFEDLLPAIHIEPINFESTPTVDLKLTELEDVLKKYCDSRHDRGEMLEALKLIFKE